MGHAPGGTGLTSFILPVEITALATHRLDALDQQAEIVVTIDEVEFSELTTITGAAS